jgi:membrane associated rhomboid family serine protease
MASMSEDRTVPSAAPVAERCYRHPDEVTGVHCQRCGRPICPECMIEAPVGYQCPECVARARREFRLGPRRRARTLAGAPATTILLYAIGAMFLVEVAVGGPGGITTGPSIGALVDLGASVGVVVGPGGAATGGIAAGEYWRMLTAVFLHAGIWHAGINALFLWNLGRFVEDTVGRARTFLLFVLTGILASVTSYALGPVGFGNLGGGRVAIGTVSVGASGAVFGFFGAYVAYNLRRRHLVQAAANLRWALIMIAINVAFGLSVRGIDNRAHLGGLVAGVAAGWLLEGIGPRRLRPILTWGGIAGMVAIGVAMTVAKTAELRAAFPGLL